MYLILRLTTAVVVGWLFSLVNVPVSWLLGPMMVGIAFGAVKGRPQPISPYFQMVGQAMIGLTIGVGFPLSTLQAVSSHALPLFVMIVITGSLSLLNGYLLWRWADIDRATGFMGSLPGAASSMVAMSDSLGADAVAVAVLQYLRVLLVVVITPPLVSLVFPKGVALAASTTVVTTAPAAPMLLNIGLLIAFGLIGGLGGRWLKLPSPTFLGPILVALIGSWTLPYTFSVPPIAFATGLLLVGLSIGARFDLPMARKLGKAAVIETGLVIALILACLLVGHLFHLVTGIDTMTAVLGSTPGGMEVMVASAAELGADTGLVLAMQMTRWVIILLSGPWVAARLVRLGNGSKAESV